MDCVCYLEYRGSIYTFGKQFSHEEMWFIVKNMELCPDMSKDTASAYAMLWSSNRCYGCSYSDETMSTLKRMELNLT